MYTNELSHHGVLGMKWGKRRYQNKDGSLTPAGKARYNNTSSTRENYDTAKANLKSAKKEYGKSFNKAYRYSNAHPIGQFANKKKSAEADKRWEDTVDKANELESARAEYKQAKKDRKTEIKNTYKDIQAQTSFGEKFIYNDATRRKAAKYVVDNNMSMDEANNKAKSDARRNTAVILAAIGAVKVTELYLKSR